MDCQPCEDEVGKGGKQKQQGKGFKKAHIILTWEMPVWLLSMLVSYCSSSHMSLEKCIFFIKKFPDSLPGIST